jgi:major intracellular serine protease
MSDCFIPPYKIHDIGDIETLSQIYPSHIRELKIPALWSKTKGRGITVAVLDTGIQTHPDLIKNVDISKCRSFIDGEDIFDNSAGHGIHVNGIIAASNDEFGIVGVAPEVTLVSVKVLNKNGRSQNDSILKGLKYCLNLNPDLINMSLGGPLPMPEVHEVIKELTLRGIPVVCSVGNNANEKNQVLYPAQYDECIAVGSYSNSSMRDRSIFSSYGDTVDILAPGEEIFSTFLNGSYAVLSGSSMAAPMVTGVIALLLSYCKKQNKSITVSEIKKVIFETAIDTEKKGRDEESGWGIINPEGILFRITGNVVKKQSIWEKFLSIFKK